MRNGSSSRTAVASWALYDFAETVFSMNVVSRYFPLWLAADMGAPDWLFPVVMSFSMVCVATTSPGLGKISDAAGRRKPFLVSVSLACTMLTASLAWSRSLPWAVAIFVGAYFFYNTALVFYNALLDTVSRGFSRAHVSGLGTALGYAGAMAGLVLTWPYVSASVYAGMPAPVRALVDATSVEAFTPGADVLRANVFLPTAALYLLFALPCLVLVRDRFPSPSQSPSDMPGARTGSIAWKQVVRAPLELRAVLRELRARPAVARFMLASFFLLDAMHTVIAFMAVYAANAVGMGSDRITLLLFIAPAFAFLGSLGYGALAHRTSARAGMHVCFANWTLGIALALAALSEGAFWVAGFLVGMGLGGVWTVARVRLLELVPPEEAGKFFGLFALTGKCSAIAGFALWALTVWLLDPFAWKYRAVLAVLLALLLAGWWILRSGERLRKVDASA
ncbi:MAG: MFS transporter [Acidobacteriota bacterium]|nr:MAG: MFS transporter [Acidobacteriota bacterium]